MELDNGETVTPCCKPKDHEGPHEGWCLGSRFVWEDDSDEEIAEAYFLGHYLPGGVTEPKELP
jgi:hypothetical protein